MKAVSLAALALALIPTAAFAEDAKIDGFGSISAGYNSYRLGDVTYSSYRDGILTNSGSEQRDVTIDGLDLEARLTAAVPLTGKFSVQVDSVLGRTNLHNSECEGDCGIGRRNETTVAVHVYRRNADKSLLGVVLQRTAVTGNVGWMPNDYFAGGEVQIYGKKVTVYGKIGYAFGDDGFYNDHVQRDGVNGDLQIRYFPKSNIMFAVRGGYQEDSIRVNYFDDRPEYYERFYEKYSFSTWSIGGKAEYKLNSSNFGLVADITYLGGKNRENYKRQYFNNPTYENDTRFSHSGFRALVGVKLNFGSSTLYQRDRSGASLDPFNTQSQYFYY